MEKSREGRKWMVGETISKGFGIIMVILYFVLGATFIFYAPGRIPAQYAKPFGFVLIAYGIFRAYKYFRKSLL